MKATTLEGVMINAEDDINLAVELNVFAVPTVVFFDKVDNEIARASQMVDLNKIISLFK